MGNELINKHICLILICHNSVFDGLNQMSTSTVNYKKS